MRKRIIVVFTVVVSPAVAQNPAEVKWPPTTVPPLLQQYDFGAQVKALQNPDATPPGSAKPRFAVPLSPPTALPVPKDLHPKDVPLNQSEQEAVRVSERWRDDETPPAVGPDGRVLYSYGGRSTHRRMRPAASLRPRAPGRREDRWRAPHRRFRALEYLPRNLRYG